MERDCKICNNSENDTYTLPSFCMGARKLQLFQSHKEFNKSISKSFYQIVKCKVEAIQPCDGKSNLKCEQPSNNICSVSHSADNKQSQTSQSECFP